MQTVLHLKDASIYQGDNLVLSDVNVEVNKGDFVYLIGKTGTGKSSFMKTLYGDLSLTKGEGSIVDFDLRTLKESDIPFLRRKLGIVFQDFKISIEFQVKEYDIIYLAIMLCEKNRKKLSFARKRSQIDFELRRFRKEFNRRMLLI